MAQDECTLQPRTENIVNGRVMFSKISDVLVRSDEHWMTEPKEMRPGLLVARVIVPSRYDDVPVRVMNVTDEPIKVSPGAVMTDLSEVEPLNVTLNTASNIDNTSSGVIRTLVHKVHHTINEQDKDRLSTLLTAFSDILSTGEFDLGYTDAAQHSIDTGGARPVRQPLRRHPPSHLDAIQQHVSDMLYQGIIEPRRALGLLISFWLRKRMEQ